MPTYEENRLVNFAMTVDRQYISEVNEWHGTRTVKCNNRDDESNGQNHDHKRVDLETRRFIGVESW